MTETRVPVVFPVRFEAYGHAVQTTTRELGVEGVFVRSQKSPEEGTVVSLQLSLPGSLEADQVRARVRGVRPEPDCGFWGEFVDPPAAAIERIKQLLERRARAAEGAAPARIGAIRIKHAPKPPEPRRAFQRHAARFQVGFKTNQDFVHEYAANISSGGVFVQTELPLDLDTIVSISLSLPGNSEPVEARAVVVHRVSKEQANGSDKLAGMGVQFVDCTDEFRAAIDRAIDHLLKSE